MVRPMLKSKAVSNKFWADAIVTAAYTSYIVTSREISTGKTRYQFWHDYKLGLPHMHIFGSKCWQQALKDESMKARGQRQASLVNKILR